AAMQDNLQQQITANKNKADKNEQDIAQLRQDLAQYATISYVDGLIGDKSQIPAGGLVEMITGALSRIDGLENALGTKDDPVTAETVWGKLNALKAGLDAIETELGELDTQMQELSTKVDNLIQEFDALKADVADLAEKVNAIEDKFDAITGRLDALVTGVLIQGTDNPLFGNFSLPIGVKSNMLFQWYGTNEFGEEHEFPTWSTDYSVDGRYLCDFALDKVLQPEQIMIPASGYYGLGDEDNISLGKVYLTVNPTNVNFDGKSFSLETSKGEESRLPYGFNVKPSSEELYFGYTSRAAENGFYEADVMMPKTEEAIAKTKINIEEGLISSMGAALKDPSKRTAATLLKSLYDVMSGKLPAYAVRADWNYNDLEGNSVATAVLSQYDLAVATAQPLGYNFMKDMSFNHKLPTIGHIQNYLDRIKDKLENKLNVGMQIKVNGKEVAMEKLSVAEAADGSIEISAVGLTVGGAPLTATTTTTEPAEVMDAATSAICDAIVAEVYGAAATDAQRGEVYASVTAELLVLQAQLNGVLDDVTGSVERLTDGVYDKVMAHKDRINQMFDLYNRVANKISRILKYPNDYLQVAAYYSSKDNVNILSCEPESPTQFKGEGNYITLYLSSYNGELIVPAYKKYVAITEVNGSHDGIKELNEGGDLNKVLDGTRVRVAIPTGKLKAGNTYEITYQAIDYRGWTSTRRFYIKVN
ncbi:MAG: hypothetical protein K2G13_01740, partial [Muribaculaceae bacterium]|nr:hypothetical protein [Muribaculaceae bacterium]